MSMAQDLITTIVPPDFVTEVTAEVVKLIPTFMTELAASLTPFLGVITSAAGVLKSSYALIRDEYRVEQMRMHQERSLAVEDPARAMEAITRMLERERTNEVFNVTRGIAECGGKLAGVLADGGTATTAAIGLASAVLKLINILRLVLRDVTERRAANRLMLSATITGPDLFDACPVMGAYMICCVPTSVMLNSIFDRFFERGVLGEIERTTKHHLVPIRDQARRLVQEHRFWIPELASYPGVLSVNKKKLKEMMKKKGKTGMEGFGFEDMAEG
jgi:hypothetical protein